MGVREQVRRLKARTTLGRAPLGAFGQARQRGVGEDADVALEAAEPLGVVGGGLVPRVVTTTGEERLAGNGENVGGGWARRPIKGRKVGKSRGKLTLGTISNALGVGVLHHWECDDLASSVT